jgi:GAF domain-containing protein
LTAPSGGRWSPRSWLAAPLTTLDGRTVGLIQVFDKVEGDFSGLDEAVLLQLVQMASAAVERNTTVGSKTRRKRVASQVKPNLLP